MRKWQNLAAPDDPASWYNVDGVWPTPRGTYETCTLLTAGAASSATNSTGGSSDNFAFVGRTLSSTREYLAAKTAIYEVAAGVYTDRTGAVAVPEMLAQYGNITIGVSGVGRATVSSSGGNFAALAGAPQGNIIVVQSNAVLIFNSDTSTDGWHASDVGDYTNWTTGEAASGRLIQTPGPIYAACAFADCVYVWKATSIYRGRYVGGAVKWAWEVVEHNVGVVPSVSSRNGVAVGLDRIMFMGAVDGTRFATGAGKGSPLGRGFYAYLYDGASPPRICNPLTTITANNTTFSAVISPRVIHDPMSNMFCVTQQNIAYFYNVESDSWGYKSALMSGLAGVPTNLLTIPIMGDFTAKSFLVPMPEFYGVTTYVGAGSVPLTWTRYSLDITLANIPDHFLQSTMSGDIENKVKFDTVTPKLRRRNGSGTAALSATFYRELENTTAEATIACTEDTTRHKFFITGSGQADNFGRFKLTYNQLDVEVEDVLINGKLAGKK